MDKKTIFLIVGALLLLGVGFYFVQSTRTTSQDAVITGDSEANFMQKEKKMELEPVGTVENSPETTPNTGNPTSGTTVKEFTLEAGSFYYKPNIVKVKKGDKVKITINSVSMMHDLKVETYNVAAPVARAGSSSSVEFVADKIGSFEFYCSVGQHRANGQVGTLVVE